MMLDSPDECTSMQIFLKKIPFYVIYYKLFQLKQYFWNLNLNICLNACIIKFLKDNGAQFLLKYTFNYIFLINIPFHCVLIM